MHVFRGCFSTKLPIAARNDIAKLLADLILCNDRIQYPIVPAHEILEKYARVEHVDWQRVQGKCKRDDNGEFRVTLSRHLCEFSYGWPYAHELGHIVMGHCDYDKSKLTIAQQRILADEANTFAAELLMPEKWLREEYEQSSIQCFRDLRKYVHGYGVSWYVMELRLDELGLCTKEYLKCL